jgi:hypothetical protein
MGVIVMAHRGPAQKAVKHGRTPNAEWIDVVDVPYTGPSPDLPRLPQRGKWHPMVVAWWEQIREMPHCVRWRATDWTFALETAFMKNAYWADVEAHAATTSAAVELRRREAQMGTTLEALRQARIRYVPADGEEDEPPADLPVQVVEQASTAGTSVATVTPLADRRARLTRSA